MLGKAKKTIKKYDMLASGDRVGVAVSGGPDSVALLHALVQLSGEYDLSLSIVHLNHGLRGEESSRDEEFVKTIGETMNIPVQTKKVSVPSLHEKKKGSIEDISRIERYKFFEEVIHSFGVNKIALGHTLDDQTETVIMNFLRGSGSEGLKGMLPVREGKYIRPLIEITRDEILKFLEKEGRQYVTDSSNQDDVYLRNRIRNTLVPRLKADYNPRLTERIGRMAELMRVENDFLKRSMDNVLSRWNVNPGADSVTVSITKLRVLHPALQFRTIKMLLAIPTLGEKGITSSHVSSVMELLGEGRPNRILDLPRGVTVVQEYDSLTFHKKRSNNNRLSRPRGIGGRDAKSKDDKWKTSDYIYDVDIPGRVTIVEVGAEVSFTLCDKTSVKFTSEETVYMDYNSLEFPLVIRNMKPGDRIQPLGMDMTKKVKSIFIDEKVPRLMRGRIPLLVDKKDVIWIAGMRLSSKVAVREGTAKVVRAEII